MAVPNPLSKKYPQIAAEWHPTKNFELTSNSIGSGDKRKVWWLGACGHEWKATINSRVSGSGCHYCSGYKTLAGFNDLATTHPQVAVEWHPKNETKPSEVQAGSHRKIWWLGKKCYHEFISSISNRTSKHTGCPVCNGRQINIGVNDLATTHPQVVVEWHPTKNDDLLPTSISAGSNRKVWWLGECGHEWSMACSARTNQKQKCPFCAGKKVLKGFNDLTTSQPNLLKEWNWDKNIDSPNEITSKSAKKVWWICEKGHEWEAVIYSRSNGNGCPYCAEKVVSYNGIRKTQLLFSIKPELEKEWHTFKNTSIPTNTIFYGSKKNYWWLCDKGHEWEASPLARAKSNTKCPYCTNKKVLSGFNDLQTTNPELSKEWHPTKNKFINSINVTKGNDTKIWWKCDKGHEWEARISDRSGKKYGCPQCVASAYVSKNEKEIANYIVSIGVTIETSVRNVIKGELDIYIPEKKIAVEYNGLYWHSEAAGKTKTYHYDKWLACRDKGIQLIQIWEDEFTNHPDLVTRMLAHKLGVTDQRKVFARKTKVVELNTAQATLFLNQNHIQGAVDGGVRLGLIEKGVLGTILAVMVLKREPRTNNKTLNLLRYATSVNVVGGFTKLLKYVEKEYAPESIITFSDNSVSDGGLYLNNGFAAVKELAPDYKYVVKGERIHKFQYRLKRFREDPNLTFEKGLSERELAKLNNLPRIWDAGKIKWEKLIK